MPRTPLHQRLISIVEPVCNAAGYELVDLRFVLEQGGWTLRVAIDTPLDEHTDPVEISSDRVDLAACEDLSRELSAVLDVEDPIPQAFHLEVSSPGIDRPLRTAAHYRHFTGSEAKIQLAAPLHLPSGERRNFKGTLQGIERDRVVIECDGEVFRLPIDDIDHARLVPDWDAVMKGKSGVGAPQSRPIKPGHRPSQRRKPERSRPAAGRPQRAGDPQSEHREIAPGDPRSATGGGVSGPASPAEASPAEPASREDRASTVPAGAGPGDAGGGVNGPAAPAEASPAEPASRGDRASTVPAGAGPRDAGGGVNGPASPVQRGRERPLSIANKER